MRSFSNHNYFDNINEDFAERGKIFDWPTTPSQDTYIRFFNKFDQTTNQKVSDYFYSWIFDNFKFDNFTLDVDSSVMTRYGDQEGAKKGYNPAKKGKAFTPAINCICQL